MINLSQMSQFQKVAALMILLGPDFSARVMKSIKDEKLLERLMLEIASLNNVDVKSLEPILDEFYSVVKNRQKPFGDSFFDIMKEESHTPFKFFENVEPQVLFSVLQGENLQMIAMVLVCLKSEIAAEVLSFFDSSLQSKIAVKIAQTDFIEEEFAREVEKYLEEKFSALNKVSVKKPGGAATLANILNCADRDVEKNIIDEIALKNPDLAENVREKMFLFEDIQVLENVDIRRVLKEVDLKDLALALKGAKEPLRARVFENMSERARAILRQDMELLTSARQKDVQEVRSKIVELIKTLENRGEIAFYREFSSESVLD